ncbi:MAG TPA: hypothetical protein VJW76_00725 [Verrucomicrobiae bacterium]|nr:hypothetical protein [Verrucomicrobiae bacterium]
MKHSFLHLAWCFALTSAVVAQPDTRVPTHRSVGRVVAWGNNFSGQSNVPQGLGDVVAVAGGWVSSMALRSDGTVVAWGSNGGGQINVPTGLRNVVALDGGAGHALALKSNGTVMAWGGGGGNEYGQGSVPTGISNVVAIAAGAIHNVVVKSDGTVAAWGDPQFSATAPPAHLSNVVAVAAGGYHNLALKVDGTVVAWGSHFSGEQNVPQGLSGVVAIAAGWEHNLALKSDGTVVAWGRNVENEIRVPPGASNIVAIAAGDYHSLALRSDGKLFAWGYDDGDGELVVPQGLTNVAAIACGGHHNLVIVTNNTAPIADAGATETRVISPNNRNARVVLDGSRSRDADGDLLQFSWFVEGATTASANGRIAMVTLSLGAHDILLRVDDGQATAIDRITIRVITADDAVDELIANLQAAKFRHPQSLLSQVRVARRAFADGRFDLGTHHLQLFQKLLGQLAERHEADPDTAAALLREAQTIVAAVSNDAQSPQLRFNTCKCEKGGRVRMHFSGVSARTYVIEASSDLRTWAPVGVGGEQGHGEFEFEEARENLPARRFYRIVAP